jgi:hypothetical protein
MTPGVSFVTVIAGGAGQRVTKLVAGGERGRVTVLTEGGEGGRVTVLGSGVEVGSVTVLKGVTVDTITTGVTVTVDVEVAVTSCFIVRVVGRLVMTATVTVVMTVLRLRYSVTVLISTGAGATVTVTVVVMLDTRQTLGMVTRAVKVIVDTSVEAAGRAWRLMVFRSTSVLVCVCGNETTSHDWVVEVQSGHTVDAVVSGHDNRFSSTDQVEAWRGLMETNKTYKRNGARYTT